MLCFMYHNQNNHGIENEKSKFMRNKQIKQYITSNTVFDKEQTKTSYLLINT